MSEQKLEQVLSELREMRERLDSGASLPTVLTPKRAAEELSISESKLRQLIRDGKILTCEIGKVKMVPRSEVERISAPTRPVPTPPRRAAPRRGSPNVEAQKLRAALKRG